MVHKKRGCLIATIVMDFFLMFVFAVLAMSYRNLQAYVYSWQPYFIILTLLAIAIVYGVFGGFGLAFQMRSGAAYRKTMKAVLVFSVFKAAFCVIPFVFLWCFAYEISSFFLLVQMADTICGFTATAFGNREPDAPEPKADVRPAVANRFPPDIDPATGVPYAILQERRRKEEEEAAKRAAEGTVNPSVPSEEEAARIAQWKSLLDSGALTQEEFDALKRRILGGNQQ